MDSNVPAILRFEDVSLHYGPTPAMDHLSFEMRAGETRIVFGAAGAGKTTLLKAAVGLVKPDSGRIFLFDEEITHLQEHDLFDVRSKAGFLFQEGGLFDSLTIAENVAYPLLNQQGRAPTNGTNGTEEKVREALRFVELEQTLEKYPDELSGGMRRRVGIARTVVTAPPLVLYDSPTAGLDPITAYTIVALIVKQREVRNMSSILVTYRYQDGHLLANFRYNPNSGRVEAASQDHSGQEGFKTTFMVMEEGRLVFEGSETELRSSRDPYVTKFVKR